jgi:hypothetical protein
MPCSYAIPSISKVLVGTGGFLRNMNRRYADMELILREFNENFPNAGGVTGGCHFKDFLNVANACDMEHGHERFRKAILRLNAIHAVSSVTLHMDFFVAVNSSSAIRICDQQR